MQHEWLNYGSILQTDLHNKRKLQRARRMPVADLRNAVYIVGAFSQKLPPSSGPAPDPNTDDFADDQPPAVIAGRADDDDHNDDALGNIARVSNTSAALMREYLEACISPGMHLSFPHRDPVTDKADYVFVQILMVEPTVTCVQTCTPSNAIHKFFKVAVQHFDRYLPIEYDSTSIAGVSSVDLFLFQDEAQGSTGCRLVGLGQTGHRIGGIRERAFGGGPPLTLAWWIMELPGQ